MNTRPATSEGGAPTADRRSARQWTALVALVVMFLAVTKGPLFWLRLEVAPLQGGLLEDVWVQVAFVMSAALVLVLAAPALRAIAADRVVTVAFASFLLAVVASSFWSVSVARTVQQSTMFFIGTAAALTAGTYLRRADTLVALWLAMQIGIGISIFARLRDWPGLFDFPGNFTGVYFNRNSLGPVATIGTTSALVVGLVAIRCGRWWVVPIALATAVVDAVVWVWTDSFTPLVATAAAVGATLLYALFVPGASATFRRLTGGVVAALLVVLLALADVSGTIDRLGRQRTWEDRQVIWEVVLDYVSQRPAHGWGFMSVWVRPEIAASLQEAGNDPVFEAHSGYLEVLLGVGVLGAVLLALVLWAACARVGAAMWQTPGVLSAFSVGLVAYALLANISETYIGPNLLPWTLLCVATGQAVALRRRAGSRGRSVVPATEPMPADVVVGDPDGEVAGPLDDTPARIGRHEAELLAQPFDDVLDFSFDRPSDDEPIGRAAEFFDDGRVEDRAGSGDAGGEYGVVP